MYRIMVCDDERIAVDAVRFMVAKDTPGATVVGDARSGRETVEKADLLRPDIVLMDIHMPGMDGISAIRAIKGRHPDTVFIIVSAFEQFGYAKDALELGVMGYLTKPLNRGKLGEALAKAMAHLDSRAEERLRELELRERFSRMLPFMEGEFVNSCVFDYNGSLDLRFHEEVFGRPLGYGYVVIVALDEGMYSGTESAAKHRFAEVFGNLVRDKGNALVGPSMITSLLAFVPIPKGTDAYKARNDAMGLVGELVTELGRTFTGFRVGIGKPHGVESMYKSYREAQRALQSAGENGMAHYDDAAVLPVMSDRYPMAKEKRMLDRLLVGDCEQAQALLDELCDWLLGHYDGAQAKERLVELSVVVKRTMAYHFDDLEEPDCSGDFRQVQRALSAWVRHGFSTVRRLRERELHGLAAKALSFIGANYHREITLMDVAKEINMSYHYFSQFFKEQTGQGFVEYLTDLRVRRAKELLMDESVSIKEICYATGYSDPNYFSKIFKKSTGLTPSEFRGRGAQ